MMMFIVQSVYITNLECLLLIFVGYKCVQIKV